VAVNKGVAEPKSAKRMPYVPPTPPTVTSAAAVGPFILSIEGDVTTANYDSDSRTIETYERQTYVLSSAASAGSTIPWQDFPFNVHYRCDHAGNCTLFRRGEMASAKLLR